MLTKVWKKSILYTAGAISVAYEEATKAVKKVVGEGRRKKPAKKSA